MPVMRKPDRTKNRSTPAKPRWKSSAATGCERSALGSAAWWRMTSRMAMPRRPSSAGTCPRPPGAREASPTPLLCRGRQEVVHREDEVGELERRDRLAAAMRGERRVGVAPRVAVDLDDVVD